METKMTKEEIIELIVTTEERLRNFRDLMESKYGITSEEYGTALASWAELFVIKQTIETC